MYGQVESCGGLATLRNGRQEFVCGRAGSFSWNGPPGPADVVTATYTQHSLAPVHWRAAQRRRECQ
jgi:hypothetical protein